MLDLTAFPRFALGTSPTALEPLDRLAGQLSADGLTVPRLWIKRDDNTGLAFGGNKTRKLEFLIGEALSQGADSVITFGATQSNHVRQTAAAAARAGLACHILLEARVTRDRDYARSGNVLLDELLGATIARRLPSGADMLAAANEVADELQAAGGRPYLIPGGGSTALGALGYAVAADEIADQVDADLVVHATGSMGTQAGLLAGFAARGVATRVLGVSVRQPAEVMAAPVAALAAATAELLGVHQDFASLVEVDDRWVGPGYGVPTPEMVSGVRLLARSEGILLDPVYAGKAFAGLLGAIGEGRFSADQDVVFVHTGGTPTLFAYRSEFDSTGLESDEIASHSV